VICRIVAGEIPSRRVHEDDLAIAIHDINPKAPFHVLVAPRAHIPTLSHLGEPRLGGHLLDVVRHVARDAGHGDNFRLVVNNGEDAGQTISHLHLHVLAFREFSWPPG